MGHLDLRRAPNFLKRVKLPQTTRELEFSPYFLSYFSAYFSPLGKGVVERATTVKFISGPQLQRLFATYRRQEEQVRERVFRVSLHRAPCHQ